MRDIARSADQIRSASGASFADAQFASYMAAVAGDWTLAEFAEKIGLPRGTCREAAFRWGIQFPDYNPFAKPKRLEWRKRKSGWTLLDGESEIGECSRSQDGKYRAHAFDKAEIESWDPRRAMKALSYKLDEMSPDIAAFNGRPIKTVETSESGLVVEVLFPADDDGVAKCREALDFRAAVKLASAA